MTSGDNVTVLAQQYPLPGSWFGVAHVDMLENRAVHKVCTICYVLVIIVHIDLNPARYCHQMKLFNSDNLHKIVELRKYGTEMSQLKVLNLSFKFRGLLLTLTVWG